MNVPETFFTVHEELILFGLSCLFGAALGVCYDVFRALRLIVPHNFVLVMAEDIVFFIGYCIFLSAFTAAAARGERCYPHPAKAAQAYRKNALVRLLSGQ